MSEKPALFLDFADALGRLKKNDNFLHNLLARHYDVQIVDTPDVIFFCLSLSGSRVPIGEITPREAYSFWPHAIW